MELERMKSGRIKVVGVSRVTIPTMFHPRVPYFVLVLEDENGNKWVQKSVKGYKMGDEFKAGSVPLPDASIRRNTVAIWRTKYDVLEGIEKVIKLLGDLPLHQNIDAGTKILILPTLISARHPYLAENTSPQFLESTIKYLTEKGAKPENIKVAGQSFDEMPIEASVQKSQLLKVCQDYRILPLDLAKTNFIKPVPYRNKVSGAGKGEGNFTFEISEEVFKSDLIINLPILKIGRASASENILKFLKKENYLGLKYLHSEEEIIENLNKVLPQYSTVAEAQSVQKSNQFVTHLNLIFSSFNSLNLDRIFAEVSMIKKLPELLKKVKIEDIPIVGRKIEEVQYEVEKY